MDIENAHSSAASQQNEKKRSFDKIFKQAFQRQTNNDKESHTSKHAPGIVKPNVIPLISTSSKRSTDEPSHTDNVDDPDFYQMVRDGDLTMMQSTIERNPWLVNYGTPLLFAVDYKRVEMCKFLVEKGADINARGNGGKTALHFLFYRRVVDTQRDLILQLVNYLLDQGARVDIQDNGGRTPLHFAARNGQVACAKLLIEKSNKEFAPSLVDQQLNVKECQGRTPLHYAIKNKHVEMCKLLVDKGADVNVCVKEGNTALQILLNEDSVGRPAQEASTTQLAEFLLDRGAHVDIKDKIGRTLFHYAAMKGHVACAKLLIDKGKELDAGSLIKSEDKYERTPLHLACLAGQTEMVRFLLQLKADVTHLAKWFPNGWNALDCAIESGNTSCVRLITEDENWRRALRNTTRKNGVDTPMRKLIRKMPEIAEEVFTKCMESDNRPVEHIYHKVRFDYEFLDDEFICKNWGVDNEVDEVYDIRGHLLKSAVPYTDDPILLKKNHPMSIMVEERQKTLLRHPLVVSLLNHKWRAYGRYAYYLNLLLYLMFIGIFNSYMLTMPPPYSIDSVNVTQSCVAIITEAQPAFGSCYNYNSWGIVAKYLVIVISAISLSKELYQIYLQRICYFMSFTNLFEVSLYVLAILTVYSDTSSAGANYVGVREDWQWQVGAVSIFLSWMVLIMFIRNVPTLGIFVLMFNHVLRTFMKFFVVLVLFIFGFAFSFHCLLQNQYAFQQWWIAVLKTSILMTGEFQFDEIFLSEVAATETGADNHTITVSTVNYRAVSYILFIIFVIIMSIIIMNLLVGLAVDDIYGVQKNAELESLAMQVKLALDVEYMLPLFIRRRVMRKFLDFYPNKYRQRSTFMRWLHSEKNLNHSTINAALNPEKNDRDRIEQKVESLDQKVESLDQKVESLKGMMSAIVSHFNIGGGQKNDNDDSNP